MPPGSVASISARMSSLYWALKRRRTGRSGTSGSGMGPACTCPFPLVVMLSIGIFLFPALGSVNDGVRVSHLMLAERGPDLRRTTTEPSSRRQHERAPLRGRDWTAGRTGGNGVWPR